MVTWNDERTVEYRLLFETRQALQDAIVIGERHMTPLHYGNMERLIEEITRKMERLP